VNALLELSVKTRLFAFVLAIVRARGALEDWRQRRGVAEVQPQPGT